MALKNFGSANMKQENTASDSTEYLGICMTCNYAPTCAHRMRQKEPIWFCEQFDDYQPVHRRIMLTSPPKDFRKSTKESVSVKGLCVNCDNLETCKLRKPENGIWHCEEYQ